MTLIQELLRDPVEPLPARPSRFDVGVAVLAAISVTLETIVVDAWPARAAEVLLAAVLTLVLPFRRTHPFGAFKVAFGVIIASQWIQYTLTAPGAGLGSGAFVLLLPHALGRYAVVPGGLPRMRHHQAIQQLIVWVRQHLQQQRRGNHQRVLHAVIRTGHVFCWQ